jgi:hypothetical protein
MVLAARHDSSREAVLRVGTAVEPFKQWSRKLVDGDGRTWRLRPFEMPRDGSRRPAVKPIYRGDQEAGFFVDRGISADGRVTGKRSRSGDRVGWRPPALNGVEAGDLAEVRSRAGIRGRRRTSG